MGTVIGIAMWRDILTGNHKSFVSYTLSSTFLLMVVSTANVQQRIKIEQCAAIKYMAVCLTQPEWI